MVAGVDPTLGGQVDQDQDLRPTASPYVFWHHDGKRHSTCANRFGHRSIQMTMRYAHVVTGHLHRAMADFGTKAGTTGTVSPGTGNTPIPVSA